MRPNRPNAHARLRADRSVRLGLPVPAAPRTRHRRAAPLARTAPVRAKGDARLCLVRGAAGTGSPRRTDLSARSRAWAFGRFGRIYYAVVSWRAGGELYA